jgi:tRNA A37 methylthiotransferase MiaB
MTPTDSIEKADLALINTCAIRENAEKRVWGRLGELRRERMGRLRAEKWVFYGDFGVLGLISTP